MGNDHNITNVQNLYESAQDLYTRGVLNGENSADSILDSLHQGIENLKNNWKGIDAGIRIQEVIGVHNAMVGLRNALAKLAVASSTVASRYRDIQIANGAPLEALAILRDEPRTVLGDYSDTADTIYITPSAEMGKKFIDTANESIDTFVNNVKLQYDSIMTNWLAGTGRDSAKAEFESFIANANTYRQTLSDVSVNITTALTNYPL